MSQIEVHCNSCLDWFYTTGLCNYGLPELEMRNVPAFLEDAVKEIFALIWTEMLDKCPAVLVTDWLSVGPNQEHDAKTVLLFQPSVPIPGYESLFHVPRWEVISVGAQIRREHSIGS